MITRTGTYGTGRHLYRCTQCGTTIRTVIPYTRDPAPYHRHAMVTDENPLPGFSGGVTVCGPLVKTTETRA